MDAAAASVSSLNAHVLVLNRHWMAVRVTDARRAFSLLVRELAEVIHVDDGSYTAHSFESWADLSAARGRFVDGELRETPTPTAAAARGEPRGPADARRGPALNVEHYEWVRTVRMFIAVPKVIRLLGYDRLPQQDVKLNRRNIFARDKNLCQYCGKHFPTSELSLDHVLPRSQGGTSTWENLVCCCVHCNARKGGRTPEQAHMALIRKAYKPRRNPVISLRLGSDKYASWRAFLDHAYWSVELK
jgi:5-methylcytosine-specific restriction endonuclease McrA